MQVSGSFPQLSDNNQKHVRQMIKQQSATGMQKGSMLGPRARRHAGSTTANRAKARARAHGKV